MVIGYIKADKEIIKEYVEIFINKIDNRSLCDNFIKNLKIIEKDKEYFFPFITEKSRSDNHWKIRFALIIFSKYYIEKQYINNIFTICSEIKNKNYYVQTAQTILISAIYLKYRNEMLEYLKNNTLDKIVQKIRSSYQVTEEEKENIKLFRKWN